MDIIATAHSQPIEEADFSPLTLNLSLPLSLRASGALLGLRMLPEQPLVERRCVFHPLSPFGTFPWHNGHLDVVGSLLATLEQYLIN